MNTNAACARKRYSAVNTKHLSANTVNKSYFLSEWIITQLAHAVHRGSKFFDK